MFIIYPFFFEWAGRGSATSWGEEKFEVHSSPGGGGGDMKVFSCHLTEISMPILLETSLKYHQTAFSCQILNIKFIRTRTIFFFRVNLQLLKFQLPLQLSYLQLNLYFCSSHHLH